jgi:hypothetical protein
VAGGRDRGVVGVEKREGRERGNEEAGWEGRGRRWDRCGGGRPEGRGQRKKRDVHYWANLYKPSHQTENLPLHVLDWGQGDPGRLWSVYTGRLSSDCLC